MYTPPFTVTDDILHLVSEISEQIGTLNARLGERMPSPMLRKENQIKTIHSSLAIEHNSLSLQQVTDVIDGKHVLGAPNEIQEVKNALQAYQLMLQLDAFSEADLLRAHSLMMADLVDNAGHFRKGSVGVFDGDKCIHVAPSADRVPTLMADLFAWIKQATGRHCCSADGKVSLLGFRWKQSSKNISRNITKLSHNQTQRETAQTLSSLCSSAFCKQLVSSEK